MWDADYESLRDMRNS